MAGNQPFRHGQRHSSAPARIVRGQAGAQQHVLRSPNPQASPLPQVAKPPILVDQFHAWLNALPHENIQQIEVTAEAQFPGGRIAGDTFQLTVFPVDENQTWIFTDIEYYAFSPAAALTAKPVLIQPHELVGLVNFSTKFSGTTQMRELARRVSPYAVPGTAAASTSGWGWLNKKFGVERMPAFALYAQGLEEVSVEVAIEAPPLFAITKVGVLMAGFSLPEGLFKETWSPG